MTVLKSTIVVYQYSGDTRELNIPFDYLKREFVEVSLGGPSKTKKLLVLGIDYKFTTKTTITLLRLYQPDEGYDKIIVRRVTDATKRIVNFQDGSILNALELNVSQLQSLHVAEEARDLSNYTLFVTDDGELDARDRVIINLGDPTKPKDAVNKKYVDTASAGVIESRDAAIKARNEAESFRDETQRLRNEAEGFKNDAKRTATEITEGIDEANRLNIEANKNAQKATEAATNAQRDSVNAASSAKNAKASEGNSKISEQNAAISAKKAEDAALSATGIPLINIRQDLGDGEQLVVSRAGITSEFNKVNTKLARGYNVDDYGAKGDGVSNDTEAFLKAQTACPKNCFVELSAGKIYRVNLRDWRRQLRGNGATLKRFNTTTDYIINLGLLSPSWDFHLVSDITFDGETNQYTAVSIGDKANSNYEIAGRWVFERCTFTKALHGVQKRSGNIGCAFKHCHFTGASFGFYATSNTSPIMHSGCDSWEKCHLDLTTKACIYYENKVDGFGQVVLKDVIMEGNKGFGLFIRMFGGFNTFNSITLDNVWCEQNTRQKIDFLDLGQVDTRDFRFDGIKGVTFRGTYIHSLEANSSNIRLDFCKLDKDYGGAKLGDIISKNSVIEANDVILGNYGVLEQSINVKSVINIAKRTVTYKSEFKQSLNKLIAEGKHNSNSFNGSEAITFKGTSTVKTTPLSGGIIGTHNHSLLVSNNSILKSENFTIPSGRFFVLSLNVKVSKEGVDILYGGGSGSYGKVTPTTRWCPYVTVGKADNQSGASIYINNKSGSDVTFYFSDFQAISFATEQEAVDYANSLLFT